MSKGLWCTGSPDIYCDIITKDALDSASEINRDPRPAGIANVEGGLAIDLRYCHYRKMDDGWYKYKNVAMKSLV